MRLFYAVFLPRPVAERLAEAQTGLKGKWKPVPPGQMHLTLLFLGEVPQDRLGELKGVGRDVAGGVPAFEARVRGTGHFPAAGSPRVWYARVEGEGFEALAQRLRELLPEFDAGPPFTPHVTLARKKGPAPRPAPVVFDLTFPVDAMALVRSQLTPRGPVYRVLETFPLKGSVKTGGTQRRKDQGAGKHAQGD